MTLRKILDEYIENDIYPYIKANYFNNLIQKDSNILKKYYKNLLICVYYSFFHNNTDIATFKRKLSMNEYNDAASIILSLLPHINDKADTNIIKSFDDMINKKTEKTTNIDINKESPKYIYSNLQYNRCIRNEENIKEINFEEDFLKHNFLFLVNTIKNTSNKLYVNWIDIFPYDIKTYQNTELYKNTLRWFTSGSIEDSDIMNKLYENIEITDDITNILKRLDISDIYETITNEFYYNVRKVKWLLYDINIDPNGTLGGETTYPLAIVLNQLFNSVLCGNLLVDYCESNIGIQQRFENSWVNFVSNVLDGKSMEFFLNRRTKIIINNNILKRIYCTIGVFFNNYYSKIEYLSERNLYNKFYLKKNLSIDTKENIENYEIKEEEIFFTRNNIDTVYDKLSSKEEKSFRNISLEHIYNFITESFDLFKSTYYSYIILNKSKRRIEEPEEYVLKKQKISAIMTLKNLYNFAKSLCHISQNSEYIELPRYYQSLNDNQKTIISKRLNPRKNRTFDDLKKWFNISNNLRNINVDPSDIENHHLLIYQAIYINLIDFVFESFITRGILSKLEPQMDLLDKYVIDEYEREKEIPKILEKTVFNETADNLYWTDSYYYLTNTTYETMLNILPVTSDKISKAQGKVSYFHFNKKEAWYLAYALHWTSQISFFNKFINNRIMYVTGGTGAGKSTQIPKLLLYAQKAILYNSTSSIVCTQPRKAPTFNNAVRVADELGVSLGTDDYKNYYVQYQHSDSRHTNNVQHLSMKFVTDGSLLVEIKTPTLKAEPYFTNNLYDIVIVDEAHEHNANMDIILSLMKYVSLYNNSVKLVIISATMDEDEPVYRRYYRDVNDNRMSPLNNYLIKNEIDRINVDRRHHISAPKQTTRYKIDEIFTGKIDEDKKSDKIIEIVRTIISSNQPGEVLIFQPGAKEIDDIVKKLNSSDVMSADTIALPYFSDLSQDHKLFIENISKNKFELRMDKNAEFKDLSPNQFKLGDSYYNRIIVVATNIAEASITIPSLKFVIETGTQKNAIFDFKTNNTKMELNTISDSSRMQRKGRVGRKSSGTVYYIYDKELTENSKTYFNFCIQDIKLSLYKLISKNSNENILFDINNDPNNPKISINYDDLTLKFRRYKNEFLINNFNTFFNIDDYFTYYGNNKHYDYDNYVNTVIFQESGYLIKNISDANGNFFIVHPEELEITRNIIGKITNNKSIYNKLENDVLYSEKIQTFWDNLINEKFLDYKKDHIIKLTLGEKYEKLEEIFDFEDSLLFKAFLYSTVFGIEEEVIRLVAMLKTILRFTDNFVSKSVVNKLYIKKSVDEFRNKFGGEFRGDFEAILKALEYYHNYLDNIGIEYDSINNTEPFIDKASKLIFGNFDNYEKHRSIMGYFNLNYSVIETDKYLTKENYLKFRNSASYNDFCKKSFDDKGQIIYNFCNSIFVDANTFKNYFYLYNKLKNTIYLYKNKALDTKTVKSQKEYNYLNEVSKDIDKDIINKDLDLYEKVLTCFILSKPYNIVRNISETDKYLYVDNPTIDNVFSISTVSKNSKVYDNFVKNYYLSGYLYFYRYDELKNSISIVNYIHPKLLQNIYHIYNPNNIGKKIEKYIKENKFLLEKKNKNPEIYSYQYQKQLKETIKEITNNINEIDETIQKTKDIEKIELFNKKIKELMS